MPTTAQNVSRIEAALGYTYSRQQILDVMNEMQGLVYAQRTDQTLKFDPTTGMPPYLVTVNNQLQYNCPTDCWMTAAVFSEGPVRDYPNNSISNTYCWQNKGYYSEIISSTMRTEDALAVVRFKENPGTTTTKFYHAYWVTAAELSDESIELVLPAHVHFVFRKAVIQVFRDENYGQVGMDLDFVENAAAKIRKELNRGAQGRIGKTPIRQEYLDYGNTAPGLW